MGSGKSTVGKILAERLNFLFIDTDKIIEIAENKKIPEIFRKQGEKFFRNLESEVIDKLYRNNKDCVFSCGGGVVLRRKNMNIIKNNSYVIFLHVTSEEAYNRLKNTKDRPILGKKDRKKVIEKLINKRKKLYLKYADLVIDNKEKNPDMIVKDIIFNMESNK